MDTRVKCACCDELLTKPVFINGKPYGSHCAKKQSDKGVKAKNICHSFEVVSVSHFGSELPLSAVKSQLGHTYQFKLIFRGALYCVSGARSLVGNVVTVEQGISITGKVFKETANHIGGSAKLYNAIYN